MILLIFLPNIDVENLNLIQLHFIPMWNINSTNNNRKSIKRVIPQHQVFQITITKFQNYTCKQFNLSQINLFISFLIFIEIHFNDFFQEVLFSIIIMVSSHWKNIDCHGTGIFVLIIASSHNFCSLFTIAVHRQKCL